MTIEVGQEYNSRFEEIIGDFDPTHTWSTAATSMLSVDVQIPGKHTIRILTEDPAYSKDAYLLAKFEVNGGVKTMREFTRPSGLKSFVVVLDEGKDRQVYKKKIECDEDIEVMFGELYSSASETRAGSSIVACTTNPAYEFHLDNDAVYVTTLPSDAREMSDSEGTGGNLYVNHNSHSINCYNSNESYNLYFTSGKYTINGSWYVVPNSKIIFLPGADVEISINRFSCTIPTNYFIINDGASVTFTDSFESGMKLYNRGSLTAKSFTLSNEGYVCNAGKMTVTEGETEIANNKSEFVNLGEFLCVDLKVEGSSHTLNTGSMITSGQTEVTSNNATWINEGVYVANTFLYTAGSNDIVNRCRLTVKDTFKMTPADNADGSICFTMTDGSLIATNTIIFEKGQMNMGSGAMISAKEMIMNYRKPDLGIHGVGSDWAVLVADVIKPIDEKSLSQEELVNYYGKLIIDTENHFERVSDNGGTKWNYTLHDEATFASSLSEVPTFETGKCSPTPYTPDVIIPVPSDGQPMSWIIACEDLGGSTSDFDYNDVVFEVIPYGDDGMAKIKPVAAGGTLEAYIEYRASENNDWTTASVVLPNSGVEVSEVHQWISQNPNASSSRMLNTDSILNYRLEEIPALDTYIGKFASEGYYMEFGKYFRVRVISNGATEEITYSSNYETTDERFKTAPRLICISGESPEWCWMQERKCIDYGYMNFAVWAKNKNEGVDWYRLTTSNEHYLQLSNMVRRTSSGIVLMDDSSSSSSNSTSGSTTPTNPSGQNTEEGYEYIIKLNGEEITGQTLTYTNGQSGTIELYKRSTTESESMVTKNVRLETSDNSVINCGGTYFSVNNPRPVTNTEFIFEKAEGSKNDITNDNKQGTLSVVSKSKKTYGNSQSISNIQMKVMIGSDTTPYGTFTINVEGEAGYTENDFTVDNDIHWFEGDWNWMTCGTSSYDYNFTSATTTTIIAKQQNADPKNLGNQTAYLRWEVNVTGDEDNTSSGSEGAFSVGTTTLTKEDIEKSYYTGDEGHYNPKVTFPGALFANATQEIVVKINTTQSLSNTSAKFGKNVYIPNVPYEYNEGNKYCTLTDNLFTMTLKDDNLSLIKKNGLELVINGGNYEYGLISSIEFIIQ